MEEVKNRTNNIKINTKSLNNDSSVLYCLTMLQTDFLFKEAMEEIIREKEAYLNKTNQLRNFWIVPSSLHTMDLKPFKNFIKGSFLEKINVDKSKNGVDHPFLVTLVSTDLNLLRWYKLRIGLFLDIGKFTINKENKLEHLGENTEKFLSLIDKEEENITSTLGYFYEVSFDSSVDNFINIVLKNYPNYISKINVKNKISY